MAFKILTSDEIELLTEQQRACYEGELAVHNERIRFVEQLEKFENTVIQPYQPVLNYIPAVSKAPDLVYSAPEYTVATNSTKIVSAPETASVFDLEITAVVPRYVRVQPASVDHISVPIAESPTLPSVSKADVPSKVFRKSEQQTLVLAQQKKVAVPAPPAVKIQTAECSLPETVTVRIPETNPIPTVSIDTNAIMTATDAATVPQIGICAFVTPDKVCMQVPQVVVKPNKVQKYEAPVEVKVALPATKLPKKPTGSFEKPKLESTAAPKTVKPVVPTKEFTQPYTVCPQLPAAKNTAVPIKTFGQTEHVRAKLVTSVVPTAPAKSYQIPEYHQSEHPSVRVSVNLPKAAPVLQQLQKTQIEYPSVGEAPKINFRRGSHSILHHPETRTVSGPDIYSDETIRSLLRSDT